MNSTSSSKTLRIFLTNAPVNLMIMVADRGGRDSVGDFEDVLLIDQVERKKTGQENILKLAAFREWDEIIDLSVIRSDDHSRKVSSFKKFKRRFRQVPGVKPVYNWLEKKVRSQVGELESQLATLLNRWPANSERVEIHMQAQNRTFLRLQSLYPKAKVICYEHGLGDYRFVMENNVPYDEFRAVFGRQFAQYLKTKGQADAHVRQAEIAEDFGRIRPGLSKAFPEQSEAASLLPEDTHNCLFLLQPFVESFQIDIGLWEYTVDHLLSQIPHEKPFHVIIKPHPLQSPDITGHFAGLLEQKGIGYTLFDNPSIDYVNIEVLFHFLEPRLDSIFGLNSSGPFYIPEFYPDTKVKFYYSYESVLKFAHNSPKLFTDIWEQMIPVYRNVFADRVVELETK